MGASSKWRRDIRARRGEVALISVTGCAAACAVSGIRRPRAGSHAARLGSDAGTTGGLALGACLGVRDAGVRRRVSGLASTRSARVGIRRRARATGVARRRGGSAASQGGPGSAKHECETMNSGHDRHGAGPVPRSPKSPTHRGDRATNANCGESTFDSPQVKGSAH